MRTRVKICGITRPDDALAAACAGADAIGLVFYAKSPRAVTVAEAQAVVRMLPPFVTTVGLFVDAAHTEIHEVLQAVPLAMLQFHGNESPSNCRLYGRPYVKAVRMREDADLAAVEPEAALDSRGRPHARLRGLCRGAGAPLGGGRERRGRGRARGERRRQNRGLFLWCVLCFFCLFVCSLLLVFLVCSV